jgi:penicillin-binding protein 1A
MTFSLASGVIEQLMMRFLKYFFMTTTLIILVGILGVVVVLGVFSRDLPSIDSLKNYQPNLVTYVYSAENEILAEFSAERRKALSVEELPKLVASAFIAAEDNEFFTHRGVNPLTILRAAIRNLQAGATVQGGSTITQQVAKSMLLTPEKTLTRKMRELLLAFKIEKALTKDEILHLYLNHIFLGNGAYGVEAAALNYFGKSAKDLSIAEAAILAGLPRAPSRDNPVRNPKAAKQRQSYVLRRMLETGVISRTQYEEAMQTSVPVLMERNWSSTQVPYFAEQVRRFLVERFGEDKVLTEGYKVFTTVKLRDQLAAQTAVDSGLRIVDKRIGLRRPSQNVGSAGKREEWLEKQHRKIIEDELGVRLLSPTGTLELAQDLAQATPLSKDRLYEALLIDKDRKSRQLIVQVGKRRGSIAPEDYKWVFEANPEEVFTEKIVRNPLLDLKVGDVLTVRVKELAEGSGSATANRFVLEQEALVQGALLSYSLPDGAIMAAVGGYDFSVTKSFFNRAYQAKRQPGSTFKPFVYGAALEAGLTPSTIIVDSPIVYRDNDEKSEFESVWKPDNFGDRFYGDTTLRSALAYSRNIPTIKLLQHLKVSNVVSFAQKLGIESPMAADLSLALGSSAVTLEELMRGWSAFANQGKKIKPFFVLRVEDRNGQIVFEHETPVLDQVITPQNAFLMTSLLRSVVEFGTATDAKALGRPVAGKTGTTNDFKDAWFLGYTPQVFSGVWIGFDQDRSLGRNETGGRSALPIWLDYMKVANQDKEPQDFVAPEGIVQVQIDGATGDLPTPRTQRRVLEYFVDGGAPGQNPPQSDSSAAVAGVNKTMVITGNPGLQGSTSSSDSSSEVNTDELLREDL